MKKKMKSVILSSLLLGGLILSSAVSCGPKAPDKPSEPDVPVTPVDKTYTIKVIAGDGGSIYPLTTEGKVGDTVSFVLTPKDTHDLETLKINGKDVDLTTRSFVAVEGENTIEASFKEVRAVITVDNKIANGTLSVDKKLADIGSEVTVSAHPESGFLLDKVTLNGTEIEINAAGKAKFTALKGENIVSGSFIEDEEYIPPVKPTGNKAIFFKPGAEMRKDLTENLAATLYTFGGTGPAVEWPGVKIGQVRHEKLKENVWMAAVNFDMYENLIFTCNGEQTADVPLTSFTDTNNMLITEGTEDGSFGNTVHSFKTIDGAAYFESLGIKMDEIVAPDKPITMDYGTYDIYFEAPEAWGTPETMGIHFWGTDTPNDGDAFPNSKMTKVEGETNLYHKQLHMKEGIGFVIATPNPDYDATVEDSKEFLQTNDIKPTNAQMDELGENATIKITVDENNDGVLNKFKYVPGEGGEVIVKKTLYFQDAPYWHDGMTDTVLLRYDAEKAIIGPEEGLKLTHVAWNNDLYRNIRKIDLFNDDLKGVSYIQFARDISGDKVGKQEPAKTVMLEVPDFTTIDMFAVQDTPAYVKDNKLAEVKTGKFVDGNTFIKTDPYCKEYGNYHIYFEAPEDWGTPETMGFHFWNSETASENPDAYPNSSMTKVEGKTNLYEKTIAVKTGTGFKFATPKTEGEGFHETGDIKLSEDQYAVFGIDAEIKISINAEGKTVIEKYVDDTVEQKLVYFQDAPWWGQDDAKTKAAFYDAEDKLLSKDAFGDLLDKVYTADGRTISSINAGAYPTATKVQFFRVGGPTLGDWGARTDKIALEEVNDLFVLTDEARWHGDGKFALTEAHVYQENTIIEPAKPAVTDFGTYHIYVEAPEGWEIDGQLGLHFWGTDTPTDNGDKFPVGRMNKVEGTTNLFHKDIHMIDGVGLIVAKTDCSAQTANIELDNARLVELGKDATIIIKITVGEDVKKCAWTVDPYEPATPEPTPDPDPVDPVEPVVENVTFYFTAPEAWNEHIAKENATVNMHAWGKSGDVTTWPGTPMELVEGNTYKVTLDKNKVDNCKFTVAKNDGTNGYYAESSADIALDYSVLNESKEIIYADGAWHAYPYTPTPVEPKPEPVVENYTIRFTLDATFIEKMATEGAQMNAHYWTDGGFSTDWPGVAMTKVSDTVYEITVDKNQVNKIIFLVAVNNEKTHQTDNIDIDYTKANEDKVIEYVDGAWKTPEVEAPAPAPVE